MIFSAFQIISAILHAWYVKDVRFLIQSDIIKYEILQKLYFSKIKNFEKITNS